MELMDTSLEALIFGGPPGHLLPLPKVLHIAIQMARGLEVRGSFCRLPCHAIWQPGCVMSVIAN